MKLYKVLSLLVCLFFFFPGMAFGKIVGIRDGINETQPISVGEVIYTSKSFIEPTDDWERSLGYWPAYPHTISYIYMGVDDNNIRLVYKYRYEPVRVPKEFIYMLRDPFPKEDVLILTLPLNSKKQTIVKIKALIEDPHPYKVLTEENIIFKIGRAHV